MKISVRELALVEDRVPVIVHSLDQALYQVTVLIDGAERLLVDDSGRTLRSHSLERLREMLARLPVASLVLRQRSAYDEMIGQPPREGDNVLEVSLALPEGEPPPLH
jgi:hypothetical protein